MLGHSGVKSSHGMNGDQPNSFHIEILTPVKLLWRAIRPCNAGDAPVKLRLETPRAEGSAQDHVFPCSDHLTLRRTVAEWRKEAHDVIATVPYSRE